MKYLRRVLPYLRPYRRLAASSVVLIFVGGLAALLTPWPLKILVDYVLPGKTLPYGLDVLFGPLAGNQVALLAVTVILSFVISVLVHSLTVVDNYVNTKLDQRMSLDFRTDLFEHSQKLSLAYHDQNRTGNLIFAINSQGDAVSRLIMTIPPVAQSAISLIGMTWICWSMDRQLTLIALTIAPLMWISTTYYMRHIHTRTMEVRMMEGESLSIVHEAVSMMRVIVAFGRERFELKRFRKQAEEAVDARVVLTVRQALFTLAIDTLTAAGTALVFGLGFYHAMQNRITVGDLLVMLTYISMVYNPLSTIATTFGSLQEVFVSLEIAFQLLDTKPDIEDSPNAYKIDRAQGHVAFDDIHFSYEGRNETLKGVSFEARPGQVVAIVGPTGAGKSTLISLIPRFYDPSSGGILLDGRDIRTITLRSLRDQISIVLQEPLLFSGTITSNIRYGREDATMDDIIEAARAASVHDFISSLPQGYETVIGERGAKLSGGERQRISIARAFLKNAPLLILDEPTSSIDTKTERVILEALDRLMLGRTTFIIAHRLSTIRRADLILVLDQGQIVERGSEQELLELNGIYRKLHDLQTSGVPSISFDTIVESV
jgi:ATP-binding cassette subfamily B protein